MAEYVEQAMEEMMNEVEQMERVMLLQSGEVKELLKKRRHFEYKLQKRSKSKVDFLEYIQYESNLLSLLQIRRETTGYHHKQAEIEGSIKTRSQYCYSSLFLSLVSFIKKTFLETLSVMFLLTVPVSIKIVSTLEY